MTLSLSTITDKSKDFEYLITTFDPVYEDLLITIDIVRQFIIDNKLIIYGGSAIDYALRLKGDKIYPDNLLKVPDLDFYSPINVEHSYQLADMLYSRGYHSARAINAQHMETMRVDLMDNHFIADITYRPQSIFDVLPYLTYNGMRVIHPDFQRLDIHSSLSFPYDNVPREVIFERWRKDIKRFNKLAAMYPIIAPAAIVPLRKCTVGIKIKKQLLTGFIAYALIYNYFTDIVRGHKITIPQDTAQKILKSEFLISDNAITFSTIDTRTEIIHYDPPKVVKELSIEDIKYFEPYINLLVGRCEGNMADSINTATNNMIIYSTHERLVSYNSITVPNGNDNITFRITNVQYLLKHFLSMSFINGASPKLSSTYLSCYVSLLHMINIYEDFLTDSGAEDKNIANSPMLLSVQTYGNDNINLARRIGLNQMNHELHDEPLYKVPRNYYPARNAARGIITHPPFNPSDVIFFREEGKEINKDELH